MICVKSQVLFSGVSLLLRLVLQRPREEVHRPPLLLLIKAVNQQRFLSRSSSLDRLCHSDQSRHEHTSPFLPVNNSIFHVFLMQTFGTFKVFFSFFFVLFFFFFPPSCLHLLFILFFSAGFSRQRTRLDSLKRNCSNISVSNVARSPPVNIHPSALLFSRKKI